MPKKKKPALGPEGLKAHELLTLAAYLLGADAREVDTEDVAVKADELSPGRFSWRKYPEQINIEIIRAFLSDAKKPKYGAYLSGTGTSGWLLTESGLEFAKRHVDFVQSPSKRTERLSPGDRQRRKKEQARIAASDAFHKFTTGNRATVSVQEAEALFRLNEYIVGAARASKVSRTVNTLGDDPHVGEAIRFFAAAVLKGETK